MDVLNTLGDGYPPLPLFHKVILNDLIFQQLQDLLDDTSVGTNQLCNVSRKYKILKKENFCWKLNRKYSFTYFSSSQYRDRISLLMNTNKQLTLDLSNSLEVYDVNGLANVYAIDLNRCHNVIDVSALKTIHILNLSHCTGIRDFSALGNVYNLNLTGCAITDCSALSSVHILNLSKNMNLVDVSPLSNNIHILDISSCEYLVDVSGLGRVHTLNLSRCKRVVDVNALGKHLHIYVYMYV